MKYIIFILIFSPLLWADYLVVSSHPVGRVNNGTIKVDDIDVHLGSILPIEGNSKEREITLYMNSNSSYRRVSLKVSNLLPLSSSSDTLGLTIYFRTPMGGYRELSNDDVVTLRGSRDGNHAVGYLKIVTTPLKSSQTFGEYNLNATVRVALRDRWFRDRWSRDAKFQIDADVDIVAVAGLEATDGWYGSGEKFKEASVNFNNFSIGSSNEVESPLFIKSNSMKKFMITFNNTPPLLLDGTDSAHKIPMSYHYKKDSGEYFRIEAGEAFEAFEGKNSGEGSVGLLKFKTGTILDRMVAGEYSASISVNVTAQ